MLGAVIMDCRGLVDPQNKPFGRVLPLEIQIKIMFWVHCFYTMDKRKKVVQELKRLPKCDLTGFPQNLGEDRWWNRMMDHRLSVSDFLRHILLMTLTLRNFFFWFQIGMMAEMARVPPNLDKVMNEGIAFIIDRFKSQIPKCPIGQLPVMIGRRKRAYDTLDKVMKRLDLIMNTMSAVNFIVIDIH